MGRGIDRSKIFRKQEEEDSQGRRLLCELAVRKIGYPGVEVARFLGVTTSAVVRVAGFEDLPGIENYL